MSSLATLATQAVRTMVTEALQQTAEQGMVVMVDRDSDLSRLLADAYLAEFPWAKLLTWDPDTMRAEEIRLRLRALEKGTLVILVQTTNFRLDAFRIRMEIFSLGLKTIEHTHLGRMKTEAEQTRYLESLTYGPQYFTTQAKPLAETLRQVKEVRVVSKDGSVLMWATALEEPKLNIGDYTGMQNVGGTFPIGEVFTEALDLTKVSGEAQIFAMANDQFEVELFEPFTISIRDGLVQLRGDEPEMFQQIIKKISESERPLVRELGFGLNPAFGPDKFVTDVTAFERQHGVHLSLGEKHSVYPKDSVQRRAHTRFHVDVFVSFDRVEADGGVIFMPEA